MAKFFSNARAAALGEIFGCTAYNGICEYSSHLPHSYLEQKLDDVKEKAISFFIGQGILNLIYKEGRREGGREVGG